MNETTSVASVGVRATGLGYVTPQFSMDWLANPEDHKQDFLDWAENLGMSTEDVDRILDLVKQVYAHGE